MTFSVNDNTVIDSNRIVTNTSGPTTSRPVSPVVGMMFFNTTDGVMEVYDGVNWIQGGINVITVKNAYAWGYNDNGRLGDNTTTNRSSPVSVVGLFSDWVETSSGNLHSIGLRANGSLWAWGSGGNGRLGNNTTVNRSSPVSVVGGFTDWVRVSAKNAHNLGVRANGTLWSWGFNGTGQLGDNTVLDKSSPVSVVGGFTDWSQASAGAYHSLGIRTNGTLWAWGSNRGPTNIVRGQLGDNTSVNRSSPVQVVGGFTDWVQATAGLDHSLGVRANGTAWAWGANDVGQLGNNTITDRSSPVQVVGGFTDWVQTTNFAHSVGLRSNGTAWSWGFGAFGRLGNNGTTNTSSPVQVVGGFTDWVHINTFGGHNLGVRANGTLWAWGDNYRSQLGDNTSTDRSSPVSVVGGFTDWVFASGGPRHSLGIRG
jgi:alpha-tubulin suppressor-like RCC1 family protein